MKTKTRKRGLTARDVMQKTLVMVYEKDSIKEAAKVLDENRISGLPVLTLDGRPIGVLSQTDVTRYEREHVEGVHMTTNSARKKGFHDMDEVDCVEHWMTPGIVTVGEDDSLDKIGRTMLRKKVHRVFVKPRAKKNLVGVVSTMDLIKGFTKQ